MSILEKFRLTDRVAVVTGGAQGLGKAMAKALAEAGATAVIADIDADLAKKTAEEFLTDGLAAHSIEVDVTESKQVDAVFENTAEKHGRIDILVTSAGIVRDNPIEETSVDEWQWHLDVDLTGVFLCCKAAARMMVAAGHGSIVNIASMSGIIQTYPQPHVAYASAKGGVIMFTKSLAAELAAKGVRVNSISPGYMATRLVIPWMEKPDWGPVWLSRIPMGRLGEPDELAGAVLFLASDASSYVTGQNMIIDGGYTVW